MTVNGYNIAPKANLIGANLFATVLTGADLSGADLSWANLSEAYLSEANLSGADLSWANLSGADLSEANLSGAILIGANLSGANLLEATLPDYHRLPLTGEFTCYKKLRDNSVAELLVPAEAKRTSCLVSNKCRVEYAYVISITDNIRTTTPPVTAGHGYYRPEFVYIVGRKVEPDSYNDDIRIECTHGIHVFATRKEAEAYCG